MNCPDCGTEMIPAPQYQGQRCAACGVIWSGGNATFMGRKSGKSCGCPAEAPQEGTKTMGGEVERGLLREFVGWAEKYPSSCIYSHGEISRIAAEHDALVARVKSLPAATAEAPPNESRGASAVGRPPETGVYWRRHGQVYAVLTAVSRHVDHGLQYRDVWPVTQTEWSNWHPVLDHVEWVPLALPRFSDTAGQPPVAPLERPPDEPREHGRRVPLKAPSAGGDQ